jgi:hypothetical protein
MSVYTASENAFEPQYLRTLEKRILASRYFVANNLNRDFVGTRGFSVVFRRAEVARVVAEFPFFAPYLERVLDPTCNAFYLNPLLLGPGSRVDPHVDRSLRAYHPTITEPRVVSVLYVLVPPDLIGGELVLARKKRSLARIRPAANLLVTFGGDLLHSVARVESESRRLSLVCEQYALTDGELEAVPPYQVERGSRAYD